MMELRESKRSPRSLKNKRTRLKTLLMPKLKRILKKITRLTFLQTLNTSLRREKMILFQTKQTFMMKPFPLARPHLSKRSKK